MKDRLSSGAHEFRARVNQPIRKVGEIGRHATDLVKKKGVQVASMATGAVLLASCGRVDAGPSVLLSRLQTPSTASGQTYDFKPAEENIQTAPEGVGSSIRLERVEIVGPYGQVFAHNAANKPETFQEALKSACENIEADVQYFNNKLVVAHDREQFFSLSQEDQANQELQTISSEIIKHKKNFHLDIKFGIKDEQAVTQFITYVNSLPAQTKITFSSQNWEVLERIVKDIKQFDTLPRVLFTVTGNNQNTFDKFNALKLNEKNNDKQKKVVFGVSLSKEFATKETMTTLTQNGAAFKLVWTEDNAAIARQLHQDGADGVTTNMFKEFSMQKEGSVKTDEIIDFVIWDRRKYGSAAVFGRAA